MEYKGKNGSRKTKSEAITLTHIRIDGGLGQFASGRYDGKWSDSGFILKRESIGFCDKLDDLVQEKKETLKMTPKFLAWVIKNGHRETAVGKGLEKEIKSLDLSTLSSRRLLEIKMKILSGQMDIKIWFWGKGPRLEITFDI